VFFEILQPANEAFLPGDSQAMATWRQFSVPWVANDIHDSIKTMDWPEIVALLKSNPPGTIPRFNGSPWHPTPIIDLIGIKDRKYLDYNATHRLRGPEDVARYAVLVLEHRSTIDDVFCILARGAAPIEATDQLDKSVLLHPAFSFCDPVGLRRTCRTSKPRKVDYGRMGPRLHVRLCLRLACRMSKFEILVFFTGTIWLQAQSLNIPITVEDTAGVSRTREPVTFGVPVPRRVLYNLARVRLYGPDGKPVPAAFRVVSRWWDDPTGQEPSIRWIHADFFADVSSRGRSVYRLKLSDDAQPLPAVAVRVKAESDLVNVDTGPIKFTIRKKGPFLDGPGLRNADFLLRSDERIYKASQSSRSELVVEEANPLRAVIKRTGTHAWRDGVSPALDYNLRIIAYAGKPYIRLIYSFINRQGRDMSDFVRLDGLWLQAQLERETSPVSVEQLQAEPRRPGWFDAGGIGVGLRWFWQLYPKAFEVRSSRTLRLSLFPESARPQNIYTGVAKTHEMMVDFTGANQQPQLDDPLYAVAPPQWYTRDTHALERLVESSAEAIRSEYWPLVQKYDRWLVASRDAVLAKRDRSFQFAGRRMDEYGMLNFGDAMHKLISDDSRPDYGVHWETEYYDFPHTLFLHFFRTGDLVSMRTGVEAAAHLADVDISHYETSSPNCSGSARTGPGLNHWTGYSNGEFISSTSWAFYKNEGLFDRYLLTGDLWSRDVARMSADWGVCFNGLDIHTNTRSIGHGLFEELCRMGRRCHQMSPSATVGYDLHAQ
jgi:hypothetical protein